MIDLASIVIPRGYRLVAVSDLDDAVLAALAAAWAKIREQDSSIPAAIFEIGPGREVACSTVGWDQRTPVIQFNLLRDERTLTGPELLERLLHNAAHAVTFEPGKVTATKGRYHTAAYRDAALKLGLDVEPDDPDGLGGDGWSRTSLARGTQSRYKSEVGKLDRALARWSPGDTPKASRRDSGNPEVAVCSCIPSRKIRVYRSALDKGVIRCEICRSPFRLVAT